MLGVRGVRTISFYPVRISRYDDRGEERVICEQQGRAELVAGRQDLLYISLFSTGCFVLLTISRMGFSECLVRYVSQGGRPGSRLIHVRCYMVGVASVKVLLGRHYCL